MNEAFMETGIVEPNTIMSKEQTQYEYAGYQVRVHFTGEKTLSQCIQNLITRENEG